MKNGVKKTVWPENFCVCVFHCNDYHTAQFYPLRPTLNWASSQISMWLCVVHAQHSLSGKSCSGVLWTQKLRTLVCWEPSTPQTSLKFWVGCNIALNASHTARDFFLSKFYLPGPVTFLFSKTSPQFLCASSCVSVLAVAKAGTCMSQPSKKKGHPAHHHRQLMQVSVLCACTA